MRQVDARRVCHHLRDDVAAFCHEEKRDLDALVEAGDSNLSVTHLAVREMPGSGSGKELLAWSGVDADHIAAAARRLFGK
jgi:hypothetical protein